MTQSLICAQARTTHQGPVLAVLQAVAVLRQTVSKLRTTSALAVLGRSAGLTQQNLLLPGEERCDVVGSSTEMTSQYLDSPFGITLLCRDQHLPMVVLRQVGPPFDRELEA